MGARRLTGPTTEPLTLAQAKQHLRYELDDQDDAILSFVATARDLVEQRLERPLLLQTWEMRATATPVSGSFPVRDLGVELSFAAPLVELVTLSIDGIMATIDSYTVDPSTEPARVYLWDSTWFGTPPTCDVVATYTVGHATVDQVPPALVGAVRSMLGILWVYRAQLPPGSEIDAVLATVDSYRVGGALV